MVASQKIVAPINEQIGNEFRAMLQVLRCRCSFWDGSATRVICPFPKASGGGERARAAFHPVPPRHRMPALLLARQ
jgi:hypothetical protein